MTAHCRVCKIALKDGAAPPCDLYARVYVCRHGKWLGEARCPHGSDGPAVELDADLMLADAAWEKSGDKDVESSWNLPSAGSVTLLHKCPQCEARWLMQRIKQIPSNLPRHLRKRRANYLKVRA